MTNYETGFVEVECRRQWRRRDTFNTPAAWDYITNCDAIAKAAADADAIVFGSLGSRAEASRAAIRAAASAAKFTVCDVNLRPPFVDDEIVVEAACDVDLLKLNDEELLPLAEALRRQAPSADVDAACEACAKVEPAVDDASDAAGDDNAMASTIAEAAAAIGKAVSASRVVVTRGSRAPSTATRTAVPIRAAASSPTRLPTRWVRVTPSWRQCSRHCSPRRRARSTRSRRAVDAARSSRPGRVRRRNMRRPSSRRSRVAWRERCRASLCVKS